MRRRTRQRLEIVALLAIIGVGIGAIAWLYRNPPAPQVSVTKGGQPAGPATAAARPETPNPPPVPSPAPTSGPEPRAARGRPDAEQRKQAQQLYQAALEILAKNDRAGLLRARKLLNDALKKGLAPASEADARRRLSELADQTIFSSESYSGDPLTSTYILEPGQNLVQLERIYKIPHMLIERCNGIKDPRKLRPGRRLKVIEGPLHAVVDKSRFRLDLYVQDLYVKSFPVGLGEFDSTPTGTWLVSGKSIRPPYTDPRTGKIITADRPDYPLGDRWIRLKGIAGQAIGAQGYGIHGTNEPDTIGKLASLGCIRMLNKDVRFVYDVLLVNHSKVKVRD